MGCLLSEFGRKLTTYNSLLPTGAIQYLRTWSTLVQVTADGTKPLPEPMLIYQHIEADQAPSHYLNQ